MLGVSGLMVSSDDGTDAGAAAENGGGSSDVSLIPTVGGEESERGGGGGGGGGNRWPRQETFALLKIRSDMDVAFRDSSLKGPLWEEVSKKMAELGFHRKAKKCREKFENVYKYHKRTKDCRAAKSDGKTYRFFDQLEALENTAAVAVAPTVQATAGGDTVSSISPTPLSVVRPPPPPANLTSQPPLMNPATAVPVRHHHHHNNNNSFNNFNSSALLHSHGFQQLSCSSSSSTSSDDDIRRGRKRKWKECFQQLMREVIQKQEELQKKFLETVEKRERDRIAREDAWRVQEMARMNREHDLLVQERSIAAAKDAAVIAFLQKVTAGDQQNLQIPIPTQPQEPTASQENNPPPVQQPEQSPKAENGGGDIFSPSRWPKAEVEALIDLRTNMDVKYPESGPKGPLWEEISSAMAKIGYSRSAKRCKEKWENINKYFKKVKESNKKRSEGSKTCPYFHQLEAIYKEKTRNDVVVVPFINSPDYSARTADVSPMVPITAQPKQEWPFSGNSHRHDSDGSDDRNLEEEDDDEAVGYEILTNKQQQQQQPPPPHPVANAAEES